MTHPPCCDPKATTPLPTWLAEHSRALDLREHWPFFHTRQPITATDREAIRALEPSAAQQLWRRFVCAEPRARHPMLLPAEHWLGSHSRRGPDWRAAWDHAVEPDTVRAFLAAELDWGPTTPLVFFWMSTRACSVAWVVFLRTWRSFLFDDEGPFLLHLERPEAVCFGPDGSLRVVPASSSSA